MSFDSPVISIVTVTFKDFGGLKSMASSLAEQQYDKIEHIIVDGGSADGTVEWLTSYTPPYLVKWSSEPDDGIFDAMNKGAARATGDLIVFMNSGDKFSDPKVLSFVAEDWATSRWDWAFGEMTYVNDEGLYSGRTNQYLFEPRRLQLGLSFAPHQATYFRRAFFRQLGGYDLSFDYACDQELAIRASAMSIPTTWPKNLAEFLLGGTHSQASMWNREHLYHRMRAKNEKLVWGNLAPDLLYTWMMASYRTLRKIASRVRR